MSHKFQSVAVLMILMMPFVGSAQKLFTRNAKVSFDATTDSSPETIIAKSNSGTLVLDAATGQIEAAVLVKGFLFEKALMQEHFNENYMESSKFPKATFKGKLDDASQVNFAKDGSYKANISGELTMHGITKPVSAPVAFTVKNGSVTGSTDLMVVLKDYGISVPSIVSDKLAEKAKVSIEGVLEELKK